MHRIVVLFAPFLLFPSIAFSYDIIEHPSNFYVLLQNTQVPGTGHTADELLGDQYIPPEINSFEAIREPGDQVIYAAFKLNHFTFENGEARHEHSYQCRHHEYPHFECTTKTEFCWTEYETRCGYEYEYVCSWYNGQQYCRWEPVYRCRQYPVRRCMWTDTPVQYFEDHIHRGNLPFFDSQESIPVTIYFPSNAPLTGSRTETFSLKHDGKKAEIKFDQTAYFYSVERMETTTQGISIWLKAFSREELMDPRKVTLKVDRGATWSWKADDLLYGAKGISTSYHLKVESCFLLFCDKPINHYSFSPFELFQPPLKDGAMWNILLEVERNGSLIGSPIRFSHSYQYKDG